MIYKNKKQFWENRLIFHGPESFGDKVAVVEKKVQAEIQKQTPDKKPVDIVDEKAIDVKIAATEMAIDKSPIKDKYKQGIRDELKALLDSRKGELQKANVNTQNDLLKIYAETSRDLAQFDKRPEVAETYKTLEPFFLNKDKIAPIINLETYRADGSYWKTINSNLAAIGISEELIKGIQKRLGVTPDGKFGAGTINAVSEMLGLGIKVEIGDETKFTGEKESVETKEQGPNDFNAQLEQLPEKIERISAAEKALGAAAQNYLNNLMGNGKSREGHEGDFEDYLKAYNNLLSSTEGVVKTVQTFIENNTIPKELKAQFAGIMSKKTDLSITSLTEDQGVHGGVKITLMQMNIPTTIADLYQMKQMGEGTLLIERRRLYVQSGDPKYKEAYDKSQDAITGQLHKEVDDGVDNAAKSDKDNGLDAAKIEGLKKSVSDASNKIISEFDVIQRLQVENPAEAYKKAIQLKSNLISLGNGDGKAFNVDMKALATAPNLRIMISKIAENFIKQTELAIADIALKNKEVVTYRDDSALYKQRAELFIKAATRLFKQIEGGMDIPGESFMQVLHEGANELLNSPLRKRLQESKAPELIRSLKGIDQTNANVENLSKFDENVNKFMDATNQIANAILRVKGSADNFASFAKDLGKELAIVSASIAGALAMGALITATGGAALAAAPAVVSVLFTATAMGLGGAIGSKYSQAAIEGNTDAIMDSKEMMIAWGEGTAFALAFGGAGKLLQLTGRAGKSAISAIPRVRMAQVIQAMEKEAAGEVGAVAKHASKLTHELKEVAHDTAEKVIHHKTVHHEEPQSAHLDQPEKSKPLV